MWIPFARPDITGAEIEAAIAILRTLQLALGPKPKDFEKRIAEYACARPHQRRNTK